MEIAARNKTVWKRGKVGEEVKGPRGKNPSHEKSNLRSM